MSGPEATELEVVDAVLAGRAVPPEHAELAELALLLQSERPEPTPGWSAQLDGRVTAGFPRPPRRRLQIPWAALRPAFGLAAVVALAVVIGVSSGGGGQDDAASGGGGGSGAMPATQASGESAAGAGESLAPVAPQSRGGGGDPASDARNRRQVERSAAMTLAAPPRELDRVAAAAGDVAGDLGGFVASSRVASPGGGQLELRVPSRRVDTAIERLSDLGTVRELSRESLDITSIVVSARDRLADARAERRGLLRQLEAAGTLNETESLRRRLRIVSREIAAARARVQRAENRAQYANVAVTIVPERARDEDGGGTWTPGDAFGDAVRVLEVAAGVALIVLAVALPLGLAWLLAWLALRGFTRRRRERALDIA